MGEGRPYELQYLLTAESGPLPPRGRGPARRTKVGGEAGPFPFKAPSGFTFAVPQRLRPPVPLPHHRPSGLSPCGPDRGTSGGGPGASAGVDGKAGPRRQRGQGGGRGGGEGALLPGGPRREAQPLSAASRAHKPRRRRPCVRTPRAPRPRPSTPLAASGRGALRRLRRKHPGSCSSPGSPTNDRIQEAVAGMGPRPGKDGSGRGVGRAPLPASTPSCL